MMVAAAITTGSMVVSGREPWPLRPNSVTEKLSDPAKAGTPVTYSGVKTVEAALVDAGLLAKKYSDGHYGRITIDAYAKWQRACGYTGSAANGIPGRASLERLGKRTGFTVVA